MQENHQTPHEKMMQEVRTHGYKQYYEKSLQEQINTSGILGNHFLLMCLTGMGSSLTAITKMIEISMLLSLGYFISFAAFFISSVSFLRWYFKNRELSNAMQNMFNEHFMNTNSTAETQKESIEELNKAKNLATKAFKVSTFCLVSSGITFGSVILYTIISSNSIDKKREPIIINLLLNDDMSNYKPSQYMYTISMPTNEVKNSAAIATVSMSEVAKKPQNQSTQVQAQNQQNQSIQNKSSAVAHKEANK
jgi:hypothetical protein